MFETSISPTADQVHCAAIAEVNRWRGHCIELFARIEQALADTLAANGHNVPQAISAKLDAVGGVANSTKITKALDRVRHLSDRRNILVHAVSSIWTSPNGGWLWAYRFVPTGKGKPPIVGHWDRDQAQAFETQLSSAAKSLSAQLKSLAKADGQTA